MENFTKDYSVPVVGATTVPTAVSRAFKTRFPCYTGVDQILTKYAGDSTQHRDAMLSREDASHGAW